MGCRLEFLLLFASFVEWENVLLTTPMYYKLLDAASVVFCIFKNLIIEK